SRVGNGVRDRVRAERESANRRGLPPLLIQELKPDAADQDLAAPGHRRQARIDVIAGFLAAGEDEVAETNRALEQQGAQLRTIRQSSASFHVSESSNGKTSFSCSKAAATSSRSIMACAASDFHSMNSTKVSAATFDSKIQACAPARSAAVRRSCQSRA